MQITLSDEFADEVQRFCETRLKTIERVRMFRDDVVRESPIAARAMERETHVLQGLLVALARERA